MIIQFVHKNGNNLNNKQILDLFSQLEYSEISVDQMEKSVVQYLEQEQFNTLRDFLFTKIKIFSKRESNKNNTNNIRSCQER